MDDYTTNGVRSFKAIIKLSENAPKKPVLGKDGCQYFMNNLKYSLFHELAHCYTDYMRTTMPGSFDGLDNADWQACYYENSYRLQDPKNKFGYLRNYYFSETNFYDGFAREKGTDPKLLYNGQPIDPLNRPNP